jgi:hypothetical protein
MEDESMSICTHVKYFCSVIVLLFGMLAVNPVMAAEPENTESLAGLKNVNAVFDITTANPKKLLFYLNLIGNTAETINANGISTKFVLAFRGPATFYVSNDRSKIKLEEYETAEKISAKLKELSGKPNVRLEQCAVAARALKVDTKTMNKSVHVIGNSWISLIGYQNKGYALVPLR